MLHSSSAPDLERVEALREDEAIRIEALQVQRGHHRVLDDISLTVPRGSITGLLGPSGCGKSTLIRSIMGVQLISGGTVTVLGEPAGSPALRSRIGYVTQQPAVYDDLTVSQNLRYFARLMGAPKGRITQVLDVVDLRSVGGRLAGDLSGGQRARVSLASALLDEPDLLVLDEPTVGLDPVLRLELWAVFGELASRGVTVLVSTHVMDEAARCDRLLMLRDGALLASGTPASILAATGASELEGAFLRLSREVAA
jgi:ABC-2 type transport system ATP-binding protein